jgi:hypothetical protein
LSFSMADAKSLTDGIKRCLTMLNESPQITIGELLAAGPADSKLRQIEAQE